MSKKKQSWQKYTLAAVVIPLLIIVALVVSFLKWEPKPDPASEKVIRKMAAAQLNKDPNSLADADLTKITTLFIHGGNVSDIKLLEKFANLKELVLVHGTSYKIPDDTPKWKLLLTRIGIIKLPVQYRSPWELTIDIKPLTKLKHLQRLDLGGMRINNIDSLARLSELKELTLWATNITDLEPLSKLENLKTLTLVENYKNNRP